MAYSHAEANLRQRDMIAAFLAKKAATSAQRGATVKPSAPKPATTPTPAEQAATAPSASR